MDICVGSQFRKPLRHFVDVVSVIFEKLIAGPHAKNFCIGDLVVPTDRELDFFPTRERLWQINPHERLNDREVKIFAISPFNARDFDTAIERLLGQNPSHRTKRDTAAQCVGRRKLGVGIG